VLEVAEFGVPAPWEQLAVLVTVEKPKAEHVTLVAIVSAFNDCAAAKSRSRPNPGNVTNLGVMVIRDLTDLSRSNIFEAILLRPAIANCNRKETLRIINRGRPVDPGEPCRNFWNDF
jgi:hypothetical protein